MHVESRRVVDTDWAAARADFSFEPGVTYLNNGSYAPTPRPVWERVTELRRRLAAQPVDFLWRQFAPLLQPAREQLAAFVAADPGQLAFMVNVTAAVNTLASCLTLRPGRDVLVTDQEYGAMVYAWERAAHRAGAAMRTITLPSGPQLTKADILERFERALADPAQLLFVSHISFVTGLVLPVREICAMARRRGVTTVVDGAHVPGMIPLDVRQIGCDFYAGNCHKWLLAPIGSGFLYFAPGTEDRVEPLVVSWAWKYDRAKSRERDAEGWIPWLRAHEFQGTRDPCPWLATPAAIDYHRRFGTAAIVERDRALAQYARRKLTRLPKVEPAIPDDRELSAALVSYRMPVPSAGALHKKLWEHYRIEVPTIDRPDGAAYLRLSTHFYNSEADIDRFCDAVAELLRSFS